MGIEHFDFKIPNIYTGLQPTTVNEIFSFTSFAENNLPPNNFSSWNNPNWNSFDCFYQNFNITPNLDTTTIMTNNIMYSNGYMDLQTASNVARNFYGAYKSVLEQQKQWLKNILSGLQHVQTTNKSTPTATNEYTPSQRKLKKANNQDYIAELTPQMQEKVKLLEEYAIKQGIPFVIIDGYRTRDEQLALIEKYKNQPGRAAGADTSRHRKGKAIDIRTKNLTNEQCKKLGNYAKSIGMRWGGDFNTCKENWHFDIA